MTEIQPLPREELEKILVEEARRKRSRGAKTEIPVPGEHYDSSYITAMAQDEGIGNLKAYLGGKLPFGDICPFIIDKVSFYKSSAHLYVEKVSGKDLIIAPNQKMRKILEKNGKILAIPKEDENKLYQWTDFYEVNNDHAINLQDCVGSYRIDANNLKIESRNWHGYETQLFLDYLTGGNDVSPSLLKEFRTEIKNSRLAIIGYINNERIATYIGDTVSIPGKEIIFKPKYDEELDYTWLEGYIEEEEEEKRVCSRRFYKGDTRFYTWKGPEIQAFADWINGFLPFDKVKPVRFSLDKVSLGITLNPKMRITFKDNSLISQSDDVILVSKRDEIYEWIEVCKIDKDGTINSPAVTSYRVRKGERRKLDSINWGGPEKQRYIDFLDDKLESSNLKPLLATVDSMYKIYLFTYKGKPFVLNLDSNIQDKFSQGEKILVVPSQDTHGNIVVGIYKEEESLSVQDFIFDRENLRFYSTSPSRKLDGYWVKDQIEKEASEFYLAYGGLSYSLMKENNRFDLYRIIIKKYPGSISALREKLGVISPNKIQKEPISPEQANEEFLKFLKEEDE